MVVPVHGNGTPTSGFEEKWGGNWWLSQQEKNVALYVLVVCIFRERERDPSGFEVDESKFIGRKLAGDRERGRRH